MKTLPLAFYSSVLLIYSVSLMAETAVEFCKKQFDNALYQQALPVCKQAAEMGDSPSQTMLGEIYDQTGDSVKTKKWWRRAADSGYQPARNLLALKYFYGGTVLGSEKGWQQDYKKAFELWIEDSKKGVATSQFMIGVMYQKGYGVTKDLAESWFWLKLALGNGYKLATDVLIAVSREISPKQKQRGMTKLLQFQKLTD